MRRLEEQHWNVNEVSDFVRGTPVKQIADESVSVCGHGDQVHRMLVRKFNNLVRWFSHRQNIADFEAVPA